MRSCKIKKISKKLNKNDSDDVVHMFNQMIGTEMPDYNIILPKYNKLKLNIISIIKILQSSVDDIIRKCVINNPAENKACDEIDTFVNKLNDIKFIQTDDESDENDEYKKILCDHYKELKNKEEIKQCILTCNNIIQYNDKLNGKSKSINFIKRIPGNVYKPFSFSSLNIKNIITNKSQNDKKICMYIFTVLKIVLNITKDIYNIITSPDVDIKEFSHIIISSISHVKKIIPRCDKAFNKIENSVGMLENNFNTYYKDFVQSKNPSTIMESFVIDVSSDSKNDIQTTRQFKQIINYYKKATEGKIKDPKIKKVFDLLNHNFNMIDKKNKEKKEQKN